MSYVIQKQFWQRKWRCGVVTSNHGSQTCSLLKYSLFEAENSWIFWKKLRKQKTQFHPKTKVAEIVKNSHFWRRKRTQISVGLYMLLDSMLCATTNWSRRLRAETVTPGKNRTSSINDDPKLLDGSEKVLWDCQGLRTEEKLCCKHVAGIRK